MGIGLGLADPKFTTNVSPTAAPPSEDVPDTVTFTVPVCPATGVSTSWPFTTDAASFDVSADETVNDIRAVSGATDTSVNFTKSFG